jgi:hypothetical protein
MTFQNKIKNKLKTAGYKADQKFKSSPTKYKIAINALVVSCENVTALISYAISDSSITAPRTWNQSLKTHFSHVRLVTSNQRLVTLILTALM